MKKILKLLFIFILFPSSLPAFEIAGGHRGRITALVHNKEIVITGGEDGFLVLWDTEKKAAVERLQLTTDSVQSLVFCPQKEEVCIIETDGLDRYAVSAFRYQGKQKLFSIYSDTPVPYINYSANGSYIIAAGLNGAFLTLLDSQTGDIVLTPEIPEGTLPGSVTLAVTGRAERNMMLFIQHDNYLTNEGQILYLDIESGASLGSFYAPGFSDPVIFNNNSLMAGISSGTLTLIDAASGAVLDIIENIETNALLCPSENGFYCLRQRNSNAVLYRYSVDGRGRLSARQVFSLSLGNEEVGSFAYNGSFVFASSKGTVFLAEGQNKIIPFSFSFQTRITEIAAGETAIAFRTEDGELGFLPVNYRLLEETDKLVLERKNFFTHITPINSGGFLLWQNTNTRNAPQIIYPNHQADEASLNFMLSRFPLRSIDSKDDSLLVLNSSGSLSVYDLGDLSSEAQWTFSSAGATDAAFINNEYIALCRSAIGSNSPFLFVHIKTGETVPVYYSTQAALTVTAVKSGKLYAEAVQRDRERFITTVVDLTPAIGRSRASAFMSTPVMIYEYRGEAEHLSIAESAGNLAIACGSEGAVLFKQEPVNFERTNALPIKLLGCDEFFISLDAEGNIAWHSNENGKLLAVFSLSDDQWLLQSGSKISGDLVRF